MFVHGKKGVETIPLENSNGVAPVISSALGYAFTAQLLGKIYNPYFITIDGKTISGSGGFIPIQDGQIISIIIDTIAGKQATYSGVDYTEVDVENYHNSL